MANEQIVLGGGGVNKRENKDSISSAQETVSAAEQQSDSVEDIAKKHNIPSEFLDNEFKVMTESVDLPSGGAFYPNRKSSVTLKYLTAEEDDILYSPDLIRSGRVLDALLDKSVIDRDLRPSDMISGDRNFLLIEMRKSGLGSEYVPGEVQCRSCGEIASPVINLDLLKAKPLDIEPDEYGEYSVFLPLMKMNIKFRFLTGKDEVRLAKLTEKKQGKPGGFKVSNIITEKYLMQIMEVNEQRDKTYIKKFITAMPMRDSMFFREYLNRIEPGLDLSYEFECGSCGDLDVKDIPITSKLFYPDLKE